MSYSAKGPSQKFTCMQVNFWFEIKHIILFPISLKVGHWLSWAWVGLGKENRNTLLIPFMKVQGSSKIPSGSCVACSQKSCCEPVGWRMNGVCVNAGLARWQNWL